MRKIVTLAALLGILVSTHGGIFVHTLFQLRHEHIAEHHCENRQVPESDCNGFCFLKNRIAESERHSHEESITFQSSSVLYYLSAGTPVILPCPEAAASYPSRTVQSACSGYGSDIDPPPRLS